MTPPRLFLALALSYASLAMAQNTGTIEVQVSDSNGKSIPGAKLALYGADLTQGSLVESDAAGYFRFADLTPGKYRVAVAKDGYAKFQSTLQVDLSSKGRLNARLEIDDENLKRGDNFFRSRNFEQALKNYEAGLASHPGKKHKYETRIAEVKAGQGKWDEARSLVEKFLTDDPTDLDATAMLGMIETASGKPAELESDIALMRSALPQHPDNFVLYYNIGRALQQKGDLAGAKAEYLAAIKIRSDYLSPRYGLAGIQLAAKEWANSMNSAKEILAFAPKDRYARDVMISALIGVNDFAQARQLTEGVLQDFPEDKDAKYTLAYIYFYKKSYGAAEALFNELYHSDPPENRGLLGLSEIYMTTGRNTEALSLLKKELELRPYLDELKIAYGNAASRNKQFPEALQAYRSVLAWNQVDGATHLRIAMTYRAAGELINAESHFRQAIELRPNDPQPLLEMALLLYTKGNEAQSWPFYEKVLRINPDNEIALNNLAYGLSSDSSTLDRALELALRARQKNSNDPNIADTLGWVYIKRNQSDEAIAVMQNLVNNNPAHPNAATFNYHLGLALAQKGNRAEAKKALENALQLRPSASDHKGIRALLDKLGG